ncbi:MAG: CHAT domain-containing protein [Cyanobacteria bacterium J06639_14]
MVNWNCIGIPRQPLRFLSVVLLGLAIALFSPRLTAQPAAIVSATPSLLAQAETSPADSLLQQGNDLYNAGRFAEAVAVWQQAAATLTTPRQALERALVLGNLSAAYQDLGQWAEAEMTVNQSLAVLATIAPEADAQRHTAILARTLNHQGHLFWLQGQLEDAVDVWQRSALAYANANDETGVLGSLINQAKALQVLGLSVQSEALLQQVSQRLAQAAEPSFQAVGLRQLGNALRRVGKLDESRATLVQSLALTPTTPTSQSSAWLELGNTERALRNRALALGKTAEAQTFTEAALSHYEQAATVNDPHRKARAQLNQLSLWVEMGELAKAVSLLPDIETSIQMLPPGRAAVYTRLNLAQSLLCAHPEAAAAVSCQPFWRSRLDLQSTSQRPTSVDTPSLQSIGEILATVVQQAQQLADPRAQSYALGQLGELYELTQQWSEAQALTEQALTVTETIRAPEIRYRWEWQLGRLLENKGDQSGAIAAYNRAIEELKAARNDLLLVDPEVQFSFRDNVEPVYRRLISLLVSPPQNHPPSQLSLTQAIQTIDDLQLAEIENYLRCNLGQRVQLTDETVDPSAAVFYLMTLPDQLVVLLKLPGSNELTLHTLPITKQAVDTTLRSLRQELGKRYLSDQGKALGQQVYDWVIRPMESSLVASQVNTLVFVLDGVLRNVPMASLYDGQQYLIEKYAIALTPSSQLFQPEPLVQNRLQVQVFGVADFQADNPGLFPHHQNFRDLPYVATELEQVQQYLPGDEFLDAQFTRETLQTQTRNDASPIIHIATHGQFSSDPRETFIVAWDEQIDMFNLSHILRDREESGFAPLELLVLSACQTATGDDHAVLGLAGIAIQSGARSTLSSLWAIQDQSTAVLMSLFYQALIDRSATVTRATALRQAQLQLMRRPGYQAPYFWAPYVMVGGWL